MGRHSTLTKGFTDKYIQNLKAKDKRYCQREGRGFAIYVLPSGFKTWMYIYTWQGQTKYLNLGSYPAVSLAKARELYSTAYMLVQRGVSPVLECTPTELLEPSAEPATFLDFTLKYLQWSEDRHAPLWHANIKAMLCNDALPVFKDMLIQEITRRDIIQFLEKITKRAPGIVPNMQRALSGVFDYALQRDYCSLNPTYRLARAVPALKPAARTRVLSEDELRHIWRSLGTQKTHQALRLILFTAQRPGEVAGMHRREIQGDTWCIPQERAEKGTGDHLVHLTETAKQIIADREGLILDITRNSISRTVQQTCNFFGLPRWTPHDLRRTARTLMAKLGVNKEVAEAVVAHKKKGIEAVYNLYEYWPEKQAALIQLEQELLRILGKA